MCDLSVAMLYASDTHPADRGSNQKFGHPIHRGFADSIDSDSIVFHIPNIGPISGTVLESIATAIKLDIPKYDIYIMEHTHTLFSAPLIKYLYPDSILIFLAADHRLLGIDSYAFSNTPISILRKLDRRIDESILRKIIITHVDGIIANSILNSEIVSSICDTIPTRLSLPYIQTELYERLNDIEPDLTTKTAITIGTALDYKGTDLLVDAWPAVRKKHPDAKLHIVGPGHTKAHEQVEGIEVKGFVPDVAEEIAEASLYVHPARMEAFGVTILEAMRAGVPPIVTETTGARSEVRKIGESLVTTAETDALAERIINYFDSSLKQRQRWSERARDRSERFDADSRKAAFKESFESLIRELNASQDLKSNNSHT